VYSHRFTYIFLIIFFVVFALESKAQQSTSGFTVVLDPGHGGKDNGTVGKKSKEKEITLALSKKIRSFLNIHAPDIHVTLTRNSDEFLRLNERSKLANEIGADLFISIHCNHLHLPSVHGSEIYIMGLDKSEENIEIVKRENAHYFHEHVPSQEDLHSDENHILLHMFQYNYLDESAVFGQQLMDQMNLNTPIKQRGVKQAGFVVLKRAGMPGVLFETAYLSNPKDEAYLLSEQGQKKIAQSVGEAIIQYYQNQTNNSLSSTTRYQILLQEADDKEIDGRNTKWQVVDSYSIIETNGTFQFITEEFVSHTAAQKALINFKNNGFEDAKIIIISDDSSEE